MAKEEDTRLTLVQIAELLKLARDPKTHHRYATMTLRFLRNSVRRDLPQSAELAAYFCGETMSELPCVVSRCFGYRC